MQHTLRDAVEAAEAAGLDAQITVEDGVMCVLATERGPRREANDYVVRTSITVNLDGSVGGFDQFAAACAAYAVTKKSVA